MKNETNLRINIRRALVFIVVALVLMTTVRVFFTACNIGYNVIEHNIYETQFYKSANEREREHYRNLVQQVLDERISMNHQNSIFLSAKFARANIVIKIAIFIILFFLNKLFVDTILQYRKKKNKNIWVKKVEYEDKQLEELLAFVENLEK